MKLSSYLEKQLIFFDVPGESKIDFITNMLKQVANVDKNVKRERKNILNELLAREERITGAIGEGVFLPHARSSFYEDVLIAIGIPERPISTITSVGGHDEIRAIFLVIVAESKNKTLLSLLGSISQLAAKGNIISKLSSHKSELSLLNLIKENEEEFNDNLLAKNIMRYIEPAELNESVASVASKLTREGVDSLPVVSEKGKFIGEVRNRELLRLALPPAAEALSNVAFLRNAEPFEEYFKAEKEAKVQSLYRKKAVVVDKETSVMEVAFLLIRKNADRAYVVEKGRYLGSISIWDIVKRVLHL